MYIFYSNGAVERAGENRIKVDDILRNKEIIGVGKFCYYQDSHMTATYYLTRKENRISLHSQLKSLCQNTVDLRSYSCPGNGRELNEHWLKEWFGWYVKR